MTAIANIRLKMRGRLAADWTSGNEVLLAREMGVETDTGRIKFGDGSTAWNALPYFLQAALDLKLNASAVDTDSTLSANSDTRVASQKATKTYVDQIVASQDAMVFKGVIDCSANPNYPAADRGWTYRASVAGKIGGASGVVVQVGDIILCLTDATSTGDQATVGTSWTVIQTNIDGALTTANIGASVQAYDADLDALAGLGSTGLVVRTASGAATTRSVTGTANEITVSNGDGVSGAPTLSLPTAMTFTSKTVTGGTFASITLSGTTTGPGGFSVDSAGQVNGGGSNAWTIGTKNAANRIDIVSSIYRFLTSANNFAAIQTGGIDIVADVLRLRTAKTPATSGAAGNAGDIAWDASFVYVCVSTNTWKRTALSTW